MTEQKKIRTPVQERAIKTKKKIIEAAKKLFAEKGYFKTNSREIAREAGVSTGSFYMYFKDKKPLFLEVFQTWYDDITEEVLKDNLEDIISTEDKREAVSRLITVMYRAHAIDTSFHREAISMIYSDPDVEKINREEEEKVIALLTGFLKLHKEELSVKDMEAAARIIHRSAEEVIHSIRIFGSPIAEKRMLRELTDMIYRYLFC